MKWRKFIIKSEQRAVSGKQSNFKFQISNSKLNRQLKFSIQIFFCLLTAHCYLLAAHAQKIAVIVPEKNGLGENFAEKFQNSLSMKFKILDDSLSEAAFRSAVFENPFNLSIGEAKNIGAAIGCEYFLLIKSATQRRSAFQKEEYYESYAAVYVVSSRTGRLAIWKLQTFEAEKPENVEKLLLDSTDKLASEIFDKLKIVKNEESSEKTERKIEEVPDESTPEAKDFRPPLPYKRFKPEYTRLAYIYDVKATIDIAVDIDKNGVILRTEIVRWAGYGLDESVTETVRRMNWRPAERNGKTLPTRVLLRYNFKKIEKVD